MNNTSTKVKHFLKFRANGQFVAIDSSSGGYPYPVSVWEAHDFLSQDKAMEYMKKFQKQLQYQKVEFTANEIN